jgi:hypothetical protein
LAARRYEKEHQPPIDPKDDPFPGVDLPRGLISERGNVVNGIGFTVLKFAREHRELTDRDVFEATQALGETYRTLGSGLYYEKPPAAPLPQGLYSAVAEFLNEVKKAEAERSGFPSLKDSEIFQLLVFFARLAKFNANGRRLSRAFLDSLRTQYPPDPEITKEAPRIIVP